MNGNLTHLVAMVEELQHHEEPDFILDILVCVHGAREKFTGGAHELRLGGVAGTCTSGLAETLMGSWLRAARKKLERTTK